MNLLGSMISNYCYLVNDYHFEGSDANCNSICCLSAASASNLDTAADPSDSNCFCFDANFGCSFCYGSTDCCYFGSYCFDNTAFGDSSSSSTGCSFHLSWSCGSCYRSCSFDFHH